MCYSIHEFHQVYFYEVAQLFVILYQKLMLEFILLT